MNSSIEEFLRRIAAELDLPDSAYDKARERYESLGEWLNRPGSLLAEFDPYVHPQGSFRLGTPVRPLSGKEEYDLDITIVLRKGIHKGRYTQAQVKGLVRKELEAYRLAKGIQEPLEEKRRCWRLNYQDGMGFHIDQVPCIPADKDRVARVRSVLQLRVGDWRGVGGQTAEQILERAALMTVNITDNTHHGFQNLCDDWPVSNPQGYALWFVSRMLQRLGHEINLRAEVDALPTFPRKAPLQRTVQLLKRHRDLMFEDDPDFKPISVIITTLAAMAYNGEETVGEALAAVLGGMQQCVLRTPPRVPNPVDPEEDFADKWLEDPRLEERFWQWLQIAQRDFGAILKGTAPDPAQHAYGCLRARVEVEAPRKAPERARKIGPTAVEPWRSY